MTDLAPFDLQGARGRRHRRWQRHRPAMATEFARRGAQVLVTDVDDARAETVASEITAEGAARSGSTSTSPQRDDFVAARSPLPRRVRSGRRRGEQRGHDALRPSRADPGRGVARLLDVNLLGIVRSNEVFLPSLIEQGHGHVVNTSSTNGIIVYSYDRTPYAASKAAVMMLSEQLFVYLRPYGVGVSCLAPAGVMTNIVEHMRPVGEQFPLRAPDFPIVAADVAGTRVADAVESRAFLVLTADEVRAELRRAGDDLDAYLLGARGVVARRGRWLTWISTPGSTSCSRSSPRTSPPTRDALVRDLKAADRAEEAAEVKALRKPTVAVAAVNRVARTHADEVAALVEIGDELAALQADARPDRDELRDLTRQRRTLLLQLTEHAAAHHGAAGRRPLVDRGTLDTASLDEQLRDDLQRGRLTQELTPATRFVLGDDAPSRHARQPRARRTRLRHRHATSRSATSARRARDGSGRADDAEEAGEHADAAAEATERLEAAHRHIADLEAALADARAELAEAQARRARRTASRTSRADRTGPRHVGAPRRRTRGRRLGREVRENPRTDRASGRAIAAR